MIRSLLSLMVAAMMVVPGTSARALPIGGGGGGADFSDQIVDTWIAGIQNMANQWSSVQVYMTGVMGTLYDGLSANQTMIAQQGLEAEAVRDYTPGENLCRFGTLSRGLAASDIRADMNRQALNQMLLDRDTQNNGQYAISGGADKIGRARIVADTYCNPGDNDKENPLCSPDGPGQERANRDIDYTGGLLTKHTLDADFTDGKLTKDEQDVVALLYNLQAHDLYGTVAPEHLKVENSTAAPLAMQDLRAVFAARSVVRASLTRQIAYKSAGAKGGAQFMRNALREMGMSDHEARQYLDGNTNAPSLDAQMEVLSRKLFQNPNFYVNLVDKPANVKRVQASMLATRLMQRRDIFETILGREMLLSQLLESRIRDEESRVRRRVAAARGG